jgi:hypothetical protein
VKCYNHHDKNATGQCKHCYKGLCPDCSIDLGSGLACTDEHEEEVELLNSLIENSKKAYSQTTKSVFLGNLYLLLMGALFIGFGYEKSKFLIYFGILCIGYWGVLTVYNFINLKKFKTDYET